MHPMNASILLDPSAAADEAPYEVINGERVELPPMSAYSVRIGFRIASRIDEFARKHSIPDAYTDYHQVLGRSDLQLVCIAVPNYLHCGMVEEAAAAGKHIVIEKPLAMNLAEADRMIEACRKAGVLLLYAECLCFAPKYVPSFTTWWNGSLREAFTREQLLATAEIAMQRRGVTLTDAHKALYGWLHAETTEERRRVQRESEQRQLRRSA